MSPDDSSSALLAAVHWLQAVLQGSVATSIAMIAIGSVGMMMLAGHIDLRRAVRVIMGCFLLFGASAVAQGIVGAVYGGGPRPVMDPPAPYQPPASPPLQAAPPSSYDPYAGAAYIQH